MRNLLLLGAVLLAACSTNPPPPPANLPPPPQQPAADGSTPTDPTPVHGVTPGHKCTTASTSQFIGQTATDETGQAILKASNAAVLRWSPPGVMLTMDYREDRVTVWLDPAKKITQIKCG
jgi:peptidase inhibitor I78 family protein